MVVIARIRSIAFQAFERELAAQAAAVAKGKANERAMSDIEAARRIAFVLERGKRDWRRPRKAVNSHGDERGPVDHLLILLL
jgi:hypothetical protein